MADVCGCFTTPGKTDRKVIYFNQYFLLQAFADSQLALCSAPLHLAPKGWRCCSVAAEAVRKEEVTDFVSGILSSCCRFVLPYLRFLALRAVIRQMVAKLLGLLLQPFKALGNGWNLSEESLCRDGSPRRSPIHPPQSLAQADNERCGEASEMSNMSSWKIESKYTLQCRWRLSVHWPHQGKMPPCGPALWGNPSNQRPGLLSLIVAAIRPPHTARTQGGRLKLRMPVVDKLGCKTLHGAVVAHNGPPQWPSPEGSLGGQERA